MTTVARDLGEVEPSPSVVTIGNFDGVHRGHRALLRRATHAGADRGLRSAVVTFEPHPAAVLAPEAAPPRLQTLEERIEALAATAVDLVLVLPFTRRLAALRPPQFVEHVLVDGLGAVRVVVGVNFRFGHRAAGDVVTLVEQGGEHGFETEAVTLIEHEGAAISSTNIRERLARGEMAWATQALGRPYTLTGPVVRGEGRGRSIGVPTANVAVDPSLVVPADGVYAGHLTIDGVRHEAVTNVGSRPTFDGTGRTVEAHVLDGDPELYGRVVTVSFEHRLRPERRFSGPAELVEQIHRDIEASRSWLGGQRGPGPVT